MAGEQIHNIGVDHKIVLDDGPRMNAVYGWKDLTAPMWVGVGIAGPNVPPSSAFVGGINALEFGSAQMREVYLTFHPNHDVLVGAPMYFHVHWSPGASTNTGVVRWGIEYSFAEGHVGAFPATTTIYVEETISADRSYDHIITEVSDEQAALIPMPDVDSLVMLRVFRDATHGNDTFGASIWGLTADIHYLACRFATVGKRPDYNQPD